MSAQASDRCPRCGSNFHCGANDDAPCACVSLRLEAAALAELRMRYTGCLCPGCLREIAALQTPSEIER